MNRTKWHLIAKFVFSECLLGPLRLESGRLGGEDRQITSDRGYGESWDGGDML